MKISYISESIKLLLFAASVIITCIIVFLGFRATDSAKEIGNNAVSQMADINNDIKDSNLKKYDDIDVYGSDVVNLIKNVLGDYTDTETAPIYVHVKSSLSDNTYVNGAYITNIQDFTDTKYIKPTAVFEGNVILNANKVIVGVEFIQK